MIQTILIADDEKVTVDLIESILKPEGYKIVKAYNGKECLKKLKEKKIDLVLLDFFMPDMSGREVLEKIRNDPKLKNTKVAFITIVTLSKAWQQQIENLGISDYIKKPFDQKDLIKRVRNLINESSQRDK